MASTADDARHSVLSRSRELSQSSLFAFDGAEANRLSPLARSAFGTYRVLEVDVKSALTVCRMPGEPWSLNPYVGCSHDCGYCYVPDVAHVERARWGSYVTVKRNLPSVLARELRRKERREVFLSSATDPYQPAEKDHLVTRRSLELLARAEWPVRVLTRNPLVRRDATLLASFADVEVGMSVPTLDDEARRRIEPGAPPIEGRLRTLRALADEGLSPFVNVAPAYPLTGGVTAEDVAEAFAEAGVASVNVLPWRYLENVLPVIRKRMGEEGAAFAEAACDEATFRRFARDLSHALTARGVMCRGG